AVCRTWAAWASKLSPSGTTNRAGGAIPRPFFMDAMALPPPSPVGRAKTKRRAFMKIPHQALIVIANGERFKLMRNIGTPFEPKLEHLRDLDLELTNFSA